MSKRPTVSVEHTPTPPKTSPLDLLAVLETKNQLANQLQMLLDTAYELGFVITVDTVPLAPPAMGNYIMRGNVRGAR